MIVKAVVAFGDSVTQGTPHVAVEETYPLVLQGALNRRFSPDGIAFRVINAGVGGENTAEGLARMDADVIAHDPDYVLIEFGLNDIRFEPEKTIAPAAFQANLREMVARVRSADAVAVLMTPNPIINAYHVYSHDTDYYDRWGGCNGCLAEYAALVRAVASDVQTPLCDVYRAFVEQAIDAEFRGETADHRDLTVLRTLISPEDGVHPTAPGQALIAATLYRTLLPLFLEALPGA